MNRDSVKSAAATELHEATTANTIASEGREFVVVVRTSSSLATMIDNTIQIAPIYCSGEILRFKIN